ncbi:MAG: hypothetical protein JO165_05250 [Candidatus Eremiobacteraeota bacterium]|nr:hypothetical protein [Candidatus Eremiobacteraeota bacterium]
MARRSFERMALLLGTAGVAIVGVAVLRRRLTRPRAITQCLTIRAPRQTVNEFFRDGDRLSLALLGAGLQLQDTGLDARDDVITWDGGGVYLREAPGGRGTEVRLTLHTARKYPVKDAIRRAKAMLEAGEIPNGSYTR